MQSESTGGRKKSHILQYNFSKEKNWHFLLCRKPLNTCSSKQMVPGDAAYERLVGNNEQKHPMPFPLPPHICKD